MVELGGSHKYKITQCAMVGRLPLNYDLLLLHLNWTLKNSYGEEFGSQIAFPEGKWAKKYLGYNNNDGGGAEF